MADENDTVSADALETDPEILEMKRQMEELENEAQRLEQDAAPEATESETKNEQENSNPADGTGEAPVADGAEEPQPTGPSVFIGNLHDDVTPEMLQDHFNSCGTINRITILCNKFTGRPKGYAYMEFLEPEAVDVAVRLNESELFGNYITVKPKRENKPAFMLRRGRGRGRGGFRGRGGYRGRGGGGYRGRGGRGGGGYRSRYQPY